MRTPLLGQAAVFAALFALSTCLTGKEMLLRAVTHAQAGAVKLHGANRATVHHPLTLSNMHIAVTVAAGGSGVQSGVTQVMMFCMFLYSLRDFQCVCATN